LGLVASLEVAYFFNGGAAASDFASACFDSSGSVVASDGVTSFGYFCYTTT
jgi:hypothetical protein